MNILLASNHDFVSRFIIETCIKKGYTLTLFGENEYLSSLFPKTPIIYHVKHLDLKRFDVFIDLTNDNVEKTTKRCQELKPYVKQYVYLSDLSVYKSLGKENIKETDELSPSSMKLSIEKEIMASFPKKSLIIRAGELVGPYDQQEQLPFLLYRTLVGGEILVGGREKRKIQLLDVRDLVDWMITMIEKQATGTYHATGNRIEMCDLLSLVSKITNSNASFIYADEKFLIDQQIKPWSELPFWIPEFYPVEKEYMYGLFSINHTKALKKGLTLRPVEETVHDTFHWLREDGRHDFKIGLPLEKEFELIKEYKHKLCVSP